MTQPVKEERLTAEDRTRLSALYRAILSLKTKEECAAFMRDLCTLSELKAFGERFAVARLLSKDFSYRAAADETNASTTTVTRVAHWLHHGTGGYRTALARTKH
ncbi:MAG: YerC/YecD family TrpR-related protein [Patescibacteria group bacterium]